MRGTIIKREGKNGVSWRLKWHAEDPATGRSVQQTETVRGSNRDAQKRMNQICTEIDQGRRISTEKITVAELLDKWFETYVPTRAKSRNTQHNYKRKIEIHLRPGLGHYRIDKLTDTNIEEWYSELRKNGNTRGGGLSEQTILHIHSILRCAYKWAIKKRLIAVSPLSMVEAPSPEDDCDKVEFLTQEQLNKLLEVSKDSRWYLPILIAAHSGMRQGEILSLQYDCVSVDRKEIVVKRGTQIVDGKTQIKSSPKTKSSKRTVNVGDTVIEAIKVEKELQKLRKLEQGSFYHQGSLVCCREDGTMIHGSNLTIGLQRLLKKAGLPMVSFHALRHTHASLLIFAGVDILTVSRRLGHANIRHTIDLYGHLMPGQQQKAVDAIEKMLT